MRFLDNVLQGFIDTAGTDFARATYAAMRERSVGPRRHGLPLLPAAEQHPDRSGDGEGVEQEDVQAHPRPIAICVQDARQGARRLPGCRDFGIEERFSNKLAIAPTASISIICGGASPGIEPSAANVYNHKTLSGSFVVRNPYLEKLLAQKGKNDEDTWTSITTSQGSVQHLDCLDDHEKAVFKTAFEIDQRWLVEHAADRAPYHLPEPVAQHLPAGRRAQARPAPDPHDGLEARREEPLLLPLAVDPARRRRLERRHRRPLGDQPSAPSLDAPPAVVAGGTDNRPSSASATTLRSRALSCQ
jgi:ribonucleoside-diphosphate reductase alpha chain